MKQIDSCAARKWTHYCGSPLPQRPHQLVVVVVAATAAAVVVWQNLFTFPLDQNQWQKPVL